MSWSTGKRNIELKVLKTVNRVAYFQYSKVMFFIAPKGNCIACAEANIVDKDSPSGLEKDRAVENQCKKSSHLNLKRVSA